MKWKKNLFLVIYSLIDAGISFVYIRKYFLWKKAAFESTILYVPVHQTDHHPPYMYLPVSSFWININKFKSNRFRVCVSWFEVLNLKKQI